MTFKINLCGICDRDCFAEASREELRVLLALSAVGGTVTGEEELARLAGVSPARCRASIVLWQESGVITEDESAEVIINEFAERRDSKVRYDKPSEAVAASVRDKDLASFLEECGRMMGIPALNTEEIKDLEYMVTDLGLSKEYVLLLLAHLVEHKKTVTPRILLSEVERLLKKNTDTVEALEVYISNSERVTPREWEFRRKFEIFHPLSDPERKFLDKWYDTFGFNLDIIFAAYGAATKTISSRIPYSRIDRILTYWHEAGCKTVSECLDKGEAYRNAREAEKQAEQQAKRDAELKKARGDGEKTKPALNGKAKYNDFDTEDALMAALMRSYGKGSGEENGENN